MRLLRNKRGNIVVGAIASIVVVLTIVILIASYLLPVGFEEHAGVNTTNWSSSVASMWDLLPLGVILTIVIAVFGVAMYIVNRAT